MLAKIDKVQFFGSYAKGKATQTSDVDLQVVYDTLKNDIPELLEMLEE